MFAIVDPTTKKLVGQAHIIEDTSLIHIPISKDVYIRLMDFPETFDHYIAEQGEDGVYRLTENEPVVQNQSLLTQLIEASPNAQFVVRLSATTVELETSTSYPLELTITDARAFGHVLFHAELKHGEPQTHGLKSLENLELWVTKPYEKHSYTLVKV